MQKNKNIILKSLLIILMVLLLLFVLEKFNVTNFLSDNDNTPSTSDTINYGPPTDEELLAGDLKKNEIVENEEQSTDSPQDNPSDSSKKNAQVIITDASQYDNEIEVRAFVSNAIQDGTCTFLFTTEEVEFKKTMPAKGDASSTPCLTLLVPRSDFSKSGTWNVNVAFESTDYAGSVSGKVLIK